MPLKVEDTRINTQLFGRLIFDIETWGHISHDVRLLDAVLFRLAYLIICYIYMPVRSTLSCPPWCLVFVSTPFSRITSGI